MSGKRNNSGQTPDDMASLRKRAENQVPTLELADLPSKTPEEIRRVLHELQVHQIELKMQNEELRLTQEALEASRTRYFDLYDLAPVGYITLSEKGLIQEANLTAATLLATTRKGLMARPLSDFTLHADQDILYLQMKELFKTGEPQTWEMQMLRADSPPFWARLDATLHRDHGGIATCRCVISDITDRKRSEEELKRSEERFSLATRSGHLGVWDWDVKDNILVWDDRMFELYGIDRESFPSCIDAWTNGLHPEDKERAIEECNAALRGERNYDTEFRVRHPDGKVFWLKANGLVIRDAEGNAARMIGLNQDITEHKRNEEVRERIQAELIQAQKMESVGRLAGGVAHDFNNMLGVILGHLDLITDQIDSSHPLHIDIQEIRKAAERSAELTRQLLTFARKQVIRPKVIDLNETVDGSLKMLRRLIGEDIDLIWTPRAGLSSILADPSQIGQVLANLCINARDAIAGVGKVTIETDEITFDAESFPHLPDSVTGDYVMLAVSDNGCGMNNEILGKLFEPFFTTKEVGKGSGLGLSTVYGIVRQNQGLINVYSKPGIGTTVKIYWPRNQNPAEKSPSMLPKMPTVQGQGTVLLVEDEPAMLAVVIRLLQRQGYNVLPAPTPGDALRLSEKHTGEIDLLITDVVMPEMNGQELAQTLKHRHPKIKCLFMSGYTADVIVHHGVLDEGVHFIQKPFTVGNMAAKVRKVLGQ